MNLTEQMETLVEEYGFDYVISELRKIAFKRHEDYSIDSQKSPGNGAWAEKYGKAAEALLKIEKK